MRNRLIYSKTPGKPTRAQRHAVGRTLNGMTLPGTWTILEKLGEQGMAVGGEANSPE
jgi:hypothetical protein